MGDQMNTKEILGALMTLESKGLSLYVVVMLSALQEAQEILNALEEAGYAAYVRTTELGNEVVITDKVYHGDAGSARDQTSGC
jgi:hypothetical protein